MEFPINYIITNIAILLSSPRKQGNSPFHTTLRELNNETSGGQDSCEGYISLHNLFDKQWEIRTLLILFVRCQINTNA